MSSATVRPIPVNTHADKGHYESTALKTAVIPSKPQSSSVVSPSNGTAKTNGINIASKSATNSSADAIEDTQSTACRVCQAPSDTKCSNCKQAYYCSVEHQKSDWCQHKRACHPFRIAHSERFGRHLIATRAIRAGEIVLRERAIVRGPAQHTAPVCVGCLHALTPEQLTDPACACTRCGWPVCSAACQEAADHRAECALTVARGSRVSLQHYFQPHPTYQCVTALRSLLLEQHDAERWARLQQLSSHCEQRRGTEQWQQDRDGVARFIPRFFHCADRWTEEEMLRVAGIVQINGHEVPLTDPPHVAIYHMASLVEHSCRPNLTKSFTGAGELLFWAVGPIAAGEHLSICYSDVLWGTANRQHHLEQTKMFRCQCKRCMDVTEMGTAYSAIRCKRKECAAAGGVMLPGSLETWETEEWKCGTCSDMVPYAYVAGVLERAGRDLEAMEKDNEENCVKYIEHYGRWLPPQHYMLTDVKIAFVQLIGTSTAGGPQHIQTISDERLQLKVRYARELLALFDILAKAEARIVGTIHFELHAALAELGRRGAEQQSDSFRAALEESLCSAVEAIRLLRHEPIELSEGKLCMQARRNADALDGVLAALAPNA